MTRESIKLGHENECREGPVGGNFNCWCAGYGRGGRSFLPLLFECMAGRGGAGLGENWWFVTDEPVEIEK